MLDEGQYCLLRDPGLQQVWLCAHGFPVLYLALVPTYKIIVSLSDNQLSDLLFVPLTLGFLFINTSLSFYFNHYKHTSIFLVHV